MHEICLYIMHVLIVLRCGSCHSFLCITGKYLLSKPQANVSHTQHGDRKSKYGVEYAGYTSGSSLRRNGTIPNSGYGSYRE